MNLVLVDIILSDYVLKASLPSADSMDFDKLHCIITSYNVGVVIRLLFDSKKSLARLVLCLLNTLYVGLPFATLPPKWNFKSDCPHIRHAVLIEASNFFNEAAGFRESMPESDPRIAFLFHLNGSKNSRSAWERELELA